MAKLVDILQQERERDTADKWGIIHLYKTGSFYSAYEWSAWLIAVITFNDEVRMAWVNSTFRRYTAAWNFSVRS